MKKGKIKFMTFAFAMLFAVVGAFATINGNGELVPVIGYSPFETVPCLLPTKCSFGGPIICTDVYGVQAWGKTSSQATDCTVQVFKPY